MKTLKLNRTLYWSIKLFIGAFGVIMLYEIVPYFVRLLELFIEIASVGERTSEFNLIIVCVALYVTCQIFGTVADIIYKIISLLEIKEEKKQ